MSESLSSYESDFYRISSNSAHCLICNDIIQSTHVHDFKTCTCGNVSVDGGHEYIRRLFKDPGQYKNLIKRIRLSETDIKEYVKRMIHESRSKPKFSSSYYENGINAAKYYSTLWYGTVWKSDFTN